MISSPYLNKLTFFVIFFIILNSNAAFAEDEPVDIWEQTENQNEQNKQTNDETQN